MKRFFSRNPTESLGEGSRTVTILNWMGEHPILTVVLLAMWADFVVRIIQAVQ